MRQQFPFTIGEQRMAFRVMDRIGDWAGGIKDHMNDYGQSIGKKYFEGRKGVDRVFGGMGAASEVVFRGGDEVVSAIVGEEYERSGDGLLSHIRADTSQLVGNLGLKKQKKSGKREFHPVRAVTNIVRAPSGLLVDVTDMATNSVQSSTRHSVQRTLAA